MLLRGVPSLAECMQARGTRMPAGLSRRRPTNRLCRHIIHAAPQKPPAQLGFDHALRRVNGMRPLQLRVPPVQELLLLARAAVNEQQALKYNSSSLQSMQVWAEDMLDKLCEASTDRLSPQTVADVWETVATLKLLNSEFGRNAENKQLLKKLRRFQVEAGNEVYAHAQPGALLAVLKAQRACDLQEGMGLRMAELLDKTSKDPGFLESCSVDSFLHTVHFLAPMLSDLKLQMVEWMKAACDRLAPPLSVPGSPSAKRDFLHWTSEGLAHIGHFFASLPQVSWRPEPGWLLHKAEAALALMTPRTDPEPLVRLLLALLAPGSMLLSEPLPLQQGIHATCRLLQSNMSSTQRPLESLSTPALLRRLSELLLGGAGDALVAHRDALQAIDPHFPAALVSVQRANVNTQLAHPTAQLLVRLAQSCRTAQQQQQQQQQQQEQRQYPSSLHGTQVLEASTAAAANSLMKSWMSDIPDDLALLLLLPALSMVAGVELPRKIQEEMEHALAEKQRLKQLANREEVLHMVVMPIAEAGGHCFLPTTLEICLPRLDELVQIMPPSQLATLINSFSKAPWSPRSPLRTRLLAAAYQSLSRCSFLEVQQSVTACACVVRQPAVSAVAPARPLPGVQYDAKDSIPVPSVEDWSAHVEACVTDASFDLPPDARCALLHSLCVSMCGSLTDTSLYKLMQPIALRLGECSYTSVVLLMEAVATLRKAPATDAWPVAVLDAAATALSSSNLAGPDLARAVASLPAFCEQQLGIISAPSVEEHPPPSLASATASTAEAAAAREGGPAGKAGSVALKEVHEPCAADSLSIAVQHPHAVLEVGTLVVGCVTAVCLGWLEVQLIEAINGQTMGVEVGGHSNQEKSSSSSSSSSGRGRDVAGMKGRIALSHLSAAPVESPADLFPVGTLVKAVVLPPPTEDALEVSLSILVIEPTVGALVTWGPQAVFDLAGKVWSTGHGLLEEWAKSSSVSTGKSSKAQTFPGYPIPSVSARTGETGLQESQAVAAKEAAVAVNTAKAGSEQQQQQQQQQQGHDHAALLLRCRTLARNGVAALVQPSKLVQLAEAELPDYMAGTACALAACDLHQDAQLFKAYEDWSLKTMSLLPQTMSHTALSHMLWAYAQLSYQPSWGWLAGAAQHLSPHLYTMAKAEPGNLTRVLAGLHAQLFRPDFMKPFMEAQLSSSSSSSSNSSSSRGSSNPLANSPAAAPGSLYCASNLTTLPASAAAVVRTARHAGAAFVAAAGRNPSPRQQQHQRQHQHQQQQHDSSLETFQAAICALAAMNTPRRDYLCPLILQQQQQQQQQQQATWPSAASLQRLLQPSFLPAPELRPGLTWFLSVSEQLQDLHTQREIQQQEQQQQQQEEEEEEEAGLAVRQPAAQWAQFEQVAAAVLALQLRSTSGAQSAAAAGALLATASNVRTRALPAGYMPELLQFDVARCATIITAAARAAVPLPAPYVQQFLSVTIGQDMSTAAAGLALARSAGRHLTAETANCALPNLAQHLEQLAISTRERQPSGNADLVVQLRSILSAVQLCQPSSENGSSKPPSPLYLPPPSFTQAATALLSACFPSPQPPADKTRKPLSSSHQNASIVGCVGIIVDWMAAKQQQQQQQQQGGLQPPTLGSFALDLELQRQALALLAASAPGAMPALHTALDQLLRGRAGNAAGSIEMGADVWYQVLWLSHVLEEPEEQSGPSGKDLSAGGNSSSTSKLGPALQDWDMLSPAALAGHFHSQPQMMAVAFTRLAKFLEAYCQVIWHQVDSNKEAALQANRSFGALMPSAHWANLFLDRVGQPGVLAACDELMLLQVLGGLSVLGVGSRDPQTKVKAAPYLPGCSFSAAARQMEIMVYDFQMMPAPPLERHPSSAALQAIVQRAWATGVEHAHDIKHASSILMLLIVAFYDHKARQPSSDLPSFLSAVSDKDDAQSLYMRMQKLVYRAAEISSTGQLEAQHVLVVLDFVFFLQLSDEAVLSVLPDGEGTANPLSPSSSDAQWPFKFHDSDFQFTVTETSHNIVSMLLSKASDFLIGHDGTEAATAPYYFAQKVDHRMGMDDTLIAQDILKMLNRHHALPLVWVIFLVDDCLGDDLPRIRPAIEVCCLEQLLSDATVSQLVQRTIREAPQLDVSVTRTIVLSTASMCGLTKLPPYDLGNHSPFMTLRPGVSALAFSQLVSLLQFECQPDQKYIQTKVSAALRVPCIWNVEHRNFLSYCVASEGFRALPASQSPYGQASASALVALMNAALMHALRIGDKSFQTFLPEFLQLFCWIAVNTEDASVFFKAVEMIYGLKARLPHDQLVLHMTLGYDELRPCFHVDGNAFNYWSKYKEPRDSYTVTSRFSQWLMAQWSLVESVGGEFSFSGDAIHYWSSCLKVLGDSGTDTQATDPEFQLLAKLGLGMLAKCSSNPPAKELFLQPVYPPIGSSSQSTIRVGQDSSTSSTSTNNSGGSSFKLWAQQQLQQLSRESYNHGLGPADALKHSILGGCLDGGPHASRHLEVWRAALVYGLAAQTAPSNESQLLLQQARDTFVNAANKAFSDTATPPVQVEEVVIWLGPCLAGADVAADPLPLPDGLPIRHWLQAADWSGLFKTPSECDAEAAHCGKDNNSKLPTLPGDLAEADPSPQLMAAFAGNMDPRWLLQLQSAWLLCPEFKRLFCEVLSSKASWQCKPERDTVAAAFALAIGTAKLSLEEGDSLQRDSLVKDPLLSLLEKWMVWEAHLMYMQQSGESIADGILQRSGALAHLAGPEGLMANTMRRIARGKASPPGFWISALDFAMSTSVYTFFDQGSKRGPQQLFYRGLPKNTAKVSKARGKVKGGRQSKGSGSIWTKE